MTDNPSFRYEIDGAVARLTIDRPDARNSLDRAVVEGLAEGLDRAAADDAVRVVCLTGAGDRAFCAGADLAGVRLEESIAVQRTFAGILKRLESYPRPTVARIQGACLGGGLGLALACDIALAHEGAMLGTPEVHVGLFPLMISPLILRQVPRKRAMDLILTGARVAAAEAAAIGLVTRSLPADEFEAGVEKTLAGLALKSHRVLAFGKEAMRRTEGLPFDQAVDDLAGALVELIGMPDAQEGIRAFFEKRPPNFS